MKIKENAAPFRHPYGNCISNLLINKLIEEGLPYYPIFAYGFSFEYTPEEGKALGYCIQSATPIRSGYWDTIYRVYGLECEFVDKDDNKTVFFDRIERMLQTSKVCCLIDCYYDPSTEYANVYQKVHQGHGRIVTEMDSEFVYYYATHVSDPAERFCISRDVFYLACEKVLCFKCPETSKSQEELHVVLQAMLHEWFMERDYQKMIDDLVRFSEAVRESPSLSDEIDHQFRPNRVPVSVLFNRLVLLCQSRGGVIDFLEGYMNQFGNNAYEQPLQQLKCSLELWNLVKALLVKYGMAPKQSLQESMADYLMEISHAEQKAVEGIQKAICDEINISI